MGEDLTEIKEVTPEATSRRQSFLGRICEDDIVNSGRDEFVFNFINSKKKKKQVEIEYECDPDDRQIFSCE